MGLLSHSEDKSINRDYVDLDEGKKIKVYEWMRNPVLNVLLYLFSLVVFVLVISISAVLYVQTSPVVFYRCHQLMMWIFGVAFFGAILMLMVHQLTCLSNVPMLQGLFHFGKVDKKSKAKVSTLGRILKVTWIVFKVCLTIVGVLGIFAILAMSIAWFVISQSAEPKISGTLSFSQLTDKVTVERESSGMIHIRANNEHDLYFAQGVVSCQERLWEMEFQKRIGRGSLSEVIGNQESVIKIDKLMRTVGFFRSAQRDWKYSIHGRTREIIQAYTDGVNAYLDSNPKLPLEFKLLNYKPSQWEPEDIITWMKLMSWDLSSNVEWEIARYKLLREGKSMKRVEELFPPYPRNDVTILSAKDLGLEHLTEREIDEIETRLRNSSGAYIPPKKDEYEPKAENRKESKGKCEHCFSNWNQVLSDFHHDLIYKKNPKESNNWVVGASRTKTRSSLLSNDPHLRLSSPGLFYLAHLETPEGSSIGSCFAGIPSVVIGRNDHISWGVTNGFTDVQDLFVHDELNAGKSYVHKSCPNGVCNYDIRTETIKVKGSPDIVLEVKESVYGPVVNDVFPDLKDADKNMSMYWTTLKFNDTTATAFFDLQVANSYEDFEAALSHYVAPSQNFIFADLNGNIAYRTSGKVPIRKTGHSGLYPVPGNGDWDYVGFVPFNQMPHVFNPEKDFVATANNRIVPFGYNYTMGFDHAGKYRAERITEMIEMHANHTVSSMEQIQMDTVSTLFRNFSFIFKDKDFSEVLKEKKYTDWVDRLNEWDGDEHTGSQEASVWEGFYSYLTNLTKLSDDIRIDYLNTQFLIKAFSTNYDEACQARKMTCRQYAVEQFKKVIDKMNDKWSHVPKWGVETHVIKFPHLLLDQTPLKCLASRQVYGPGGTFTVNVADNNGLENNFETLHGPSYRQVISLEGKNNGMDKNSRFIVPPGQSGNWLSPKYDNFLQKWVSGQYITMTTIDYDVENTLTLTKA